MDEENINLNENSLNIENNEKESEKLSDDVKNTEQKNTNMNNVFGDSMSLSDIEVKDNIDNELKKSLPPSEICQKSSVNSSFSKDLNDFQFENEANEKNTGKISRVNSNKNVKETNTLKTDLKKGKIKKEDLDDIIIPIFSCIYCANEKIASKHLSNEIIEKNYLFLTSTYDLNELEKIINYQPIIDKDDKNDRILDTIVKSTEYLNKYSTIKESKAFLLSDQFKEYQKKEVQYIKNRVLQRIQRIEDSVIRRKRDNLSKGANANVIPRTSINNKNCLFSTTNSLIYNYNALSGFVEIAPNLVNAKINNNNNTIVTCSNSSINYNSLSLNNYEIGKCNNDNVLGDVYEIIEKNSSENDADDKEIMDIIKMDLSRKNIIWEETAFDIWNPQIDDNIDETSSQNSEEHESHTSENLDEFNLIDSKNSNENRTSNFYFNSKLEKNNINNSGSSSIVGNSSNVLNQVLNSNKNTLNSFQFQVKGIKFSNSIFKGRNSQELNSTTSKDRLKIQSNIITKNIYNNFKNNNDNKSINSSTFSQKIKGGLNNLKSFVSTNNSSNFTKSNSRGIPQFHKSLKSDSIQFNSNNNESDIYNINGSNSSTNNNLINLNSLSIYGGGFNSKSLVNCLKHPNTTTHFQKSSNRISFDINKSKEINKDISTKTIDKNINKANNNYFTKKEQERKTSFKNSSNEVKDYKDIIFHFKSKIENNNNLINKLNMDHENLNSEEIKISNSKINEYIIDYPGEASKTTKYIQRKYNFIIPINNYFNSSGSTFYKNKNYITGEKLNILDKKKQPVINFKKKKNEKENNIPINLIKSSDLKMNKAINNNIINNLNNKGNNKSTPKRFNYRINDIIKFMNNKNTKNNLNDKYNTISKNRNNHINNEEINSFSSDTNKNNMYTLKNYVSKKKSPNFQNKNGLFYKNFLKNYKGNFIKKNK